MDAEVEIDPTHPGGLCPLCDEPILAGEEASIVTCEGYQYLVHDLCLKEAEDTDD